MIQPLKNRQNALWLILAVMVFACVAAFGLSQQDVQDKTPTASQLHTSAQTVNEGPFRNVAVSPGVPSGVLSYLVNTLPPGPPRRITYDLTVWSTGQGATSVPQSVFGIKADYGQDLSLNQFSPNRRYIFLKQGIPYGRQGSYRVYLFDLLAKHLKAGPIDILHFPRLSCSPDSNYLAYVEGSDAYGEMSIGSAPLKLNVYDLRSGRSALVAQNPGVQTFVWTQQKTLLYTKKADSTNNLNSLNQRFRYDVWEYQPTTGVSVKIATDAYEPQPSPDGRWIIYTGWHPSLANLSSEATEANLSNQDRPKGKSSTASSPKVNRHEQYGQWLFDRTTKRTILFHAIPSGQRPITLLWSADSMALYSISNMYQNTRPSIMTSENFANNYPGYGHGHIQSFDVPSLRQHEITDIKATDATSRPDPESQFQIKGASKDGRYLFVVTSELGTPNANRLAELTYNLYAVDLHNGLQQLLFTVNGAEGFDWQPQ